MSEEKKSSKAGLYIIIIGFVCIMGYLFMPKDASTSTRPRATSAPATYTVRYEITGSASAVSVTYNNSQDNTEQGDYKVPFKKTFVMERGDFAYISAQNDGDTGTVNCKIYLDGQEWQEATSSGAYVIASCSGSVGMD